MLVIFFSVVPSFSYAKSILSKTISEKEIPALQFIALNTPESAVILSPYEEGFLVAYYTGREVVANSNFLMVKKPQIVLDDIAVAYSSAYYTDSAAIFDRSLVDYVYFSSFSKEKFNIPKPQFSEDSDCFPLIYENAGQVYEVLCHLR